MAWKGVIPPMCTPVTPDGQVNVERLRDYVSFLEEGGVHGLFPCGTTGEFASLNHEQRERVIHTTVDAAEDIPVLAGCGGTSLSGVRKQVRTASATGADAAVVLTPYYMPAKESGICAFIEDVADVAELPILVYHIPELTGQFLPTDSVLRLAEHPRIRGIKDTTGDLTRSFELIERTPDEFQVFQGHGSLATASLNLGVDGLIAGSANIMPAAVSAIYDAYAVDDHLRGDKIFSEIMLPLIQLCSQGPSLVSTKYLSGLTGPDLGPPLPPLTPLTCDQEATLEEAIQRIEERQQSLTPFQ